MVSNGRPIRSHLFFTHTHMDHIIGLPFFRPAYLAQNRFEFWSGHLRRQGAIPAVRQPERRLDSRCGLGRLWALRTLP